MTSLDSVLDKDGVRLTVDDAVATVTLTNPARRNAQSPALWRALTEAGRALPGNVRVVVLRGEGKSFSAGLDRQAFTPEGFDGEPSFLDMARGPETELDATIAEYQEAFTWWRRNDIISIAAVQGHAIGAGFQLALACDLRVCAADAMFSMRETSLGLVPDLGGTQPLVEAVGYSRALEICVTGRWVDAQEAREIGLATIVVPPEDLEAATSDLAEALAAPPRDAVTATKALLRTATGRSYTDQLAAERMSQVRRLRALVDALAAGVAGQPGNKGG
jgi:enoyl-CoA hydratase/carnithine racemase